MSSTIRRFIVGLVLVALKTACGGGGHPASSTMEEMTGGSVAESSGGRGGGPGGSGMGGTGGAGGGAAGTPQPMGGAGSGGGGSGPDASAGSVGAQADAAVTGDATSGSRTDGGGACNAVFCDGFEDGTMLGAAWTIDKAVEANTVEVVSTMVHSGSNAVHMKFMAGSGATFIRSTRGFPAPMNSLWGRVWMYAMMPNSNGGHNVFIEASGGGDVVNRGVRPLNTQGGSMSINVAPPDNGAGTNMKFPQGKWVCFEWQIASNGTSGSVTLFMDGAQLATTANKPIPSLLFQRVGYEHYAADKGPNELWIDDYAIGTSRIGCN